MAQRHFGLFLGALAVSGVLLLGEPVRAETDDEADAILRELADAEPHRSALRDRLGDVVDDLAQDCAV